MNLKKDFPRPCAVVCCDVIGPAAAYKYNPKTYLFVLLVVWFLGFLILYGVDRWQLILKSWFLFSGRAVASLVAGQTDLQDDGRVFNQEPCF